MSDVTHRADGVTVVDFYEIPCRGFLFFGTAEVRDGVVKFTALRKPGAGCLCSVLGLVDPTIMAALELTVHHIIAHPSAYYDNPDHRNP